MNRLVKLLPLLVLLSIPFIAQGQTVNAASCSQSDVQAALNSAATNATINVPAGSCSWSGFSIAKAVTLQGAGIGKTNITLGSSTNTVTKQSAGILRISGFTFSKTGGGDAGKGFNVEGSWKSAQPIIFQNNAFIISNTGLFRINVAGGIIFSHNSFTGDWDDSFLQIKDANDASGSWKAADTIGTKDTNGTWNVYIEDNTFLGGTNQGIDCDDACRMVNRHNTFTNSESNSHGDDTSPYGMRHFEIYSNTFVNSRDSSQLSNENQAVWIRGGTGVIYNNNFTDLAGNTWGDKPEVRLNIRGAEDVRPQGSCSQVAYPVPRQLGQNYNGTSSFTDPIYLWGNTGKVGIKADWEWGNPCGFTFSNFFQWGRDGVDNDSSSIDPNGSGSNSAKPGYTAYAYPHPLVSGGTGGGSQTSLSPPSGLQAIVN